MTSLSSEEIDHLAQLVRLSLSEEEKKRFGVEMPKIVAFVEELQAAKAGEITQEKTRNLDELRPDEPKSNSLSLEELGALAPSWRQNQVEVPGVFESEDI
jgi:aspartyl-tRNA(Asn)/glutamyl-tRNA(Gln) amidotransferase subunit C